MMWGRGKHDQNRLYERNLLTLNHNGILVSMWLSNINAFTDGSYVLVTSVFKQGNDFIPQFDTHGN